MQQVLADNLQILQNNKHRDDFPCCHDGGQTKHRIGAAFNCTTTWLHRRPKQMKVKTIGSPIRLQRSTRSCYRGTIISRGAYILILPGNLSHPLKKIRGPLGVSHQQDSCAHCCTITQVRKLPFPTWHCNAEHIGNAQCFTIMHQRSMPLVWKK